MCGFGVGVGVKLCLGDFVGSVVRGSIGLWGRRLDSVKLECLGGFGWGNEGVECLRGYWVRGGGCEWWVGG